MATKRGLKERLQAGEYIICAEGYLLEFEARGYLKAGDYVPEVVLKHPDLVRIMHKEFVHAGSDVVEAFTYYGHRAKLKYLGMKDDSEQLNKTALVIARNVADETGTLMAGNMSKVQKYLNAEDAKEESRHIFKEQIEWAVKAGADYIIAESFTDVEEAELALQCIKEYGKGIAAVVTMTAYVLSDGMTSDTGVPLPQCLKRLEDAGADVVGLNCQMGPDTMIPIMKEVRKLCKGPLACLPVAFRTHPEQSTMMRLKDHRTGELSYPSNLNSQLVSQSHIAEFTKQMKDIGVQYLGICCGNRAHYVRAMAEALERTPPASEYSPDV